MKSSIFLALIVFFDINAASFYPEEVHGEKCRQIKYSYQDSNCTEKELIAKCIKAKFIDQFVTTWYPQFYNGIYDNVCYVTKEGSDLTSVFVGIIQFASVDRIFPLRKSSLLCAESYNKRLWQFPIVNEPQLESEEEIQEWSWSFITKKIHSPIYVASHGVELLQPQCHEEKMLFERIRKFGLEESMIRLLAHVDRENRLISLFTLYNTKEELAKNKERLNMLFIQDNVVAIETTRTCCLI